MPLPTSPPPVTPPSTQHRSQHCPFQASVRRMRIEAVTCCVNYADILAHTLPRNLNVFDSILVVTTPEDKQTQKVCQYYRVPYLMTDAFDARWGNFKKGQAINEGLRHLKRQDWICHFDSDIVFPPHTREALERADLDTKSLYGADRLECKSYRDWHRFLDDPEPPIAAADYLIHTTHSPFQVATRVQMQHSGGYIPIGFFQLWHADSGILQYPEGHSDAGREDSHFAMQWPRAKRHLLPEILVYHLESEDAPMAVNWKKRTTKPFAHA